jgi:hypothetical protein
MSLGEASSGGKREIEFGERVGDTSRGSDGEESLARVALV